MRLPRLDLNVTLTGLACIVLLPGAILTLTDHVVIAGCLDLVGTLLLVTWALHVSRQIREGQRQLQELVRDLQRTWPPTVSPPESDD